MTDEGSAGLLWRTPPRAARVASGKYSQAPSDRIGAFRPAALDPEGQAHFRLPGPALVEKDFYVVKALAAIAAVETEALHLRLVFGGGTPLSRAHRLIRRMSEDIDPRSSSTAIGRGAGHCGAYCPGHGNLARCRVQIRP